MNKGDIIKLGKYPQDTINAEPIEWVVLDIDDTNNTAICISKYALDTRQYHHCEPYPAWENSDICMWLNGEFFQKAFDNAEKEKILLWEMAGKTDDGKQCYDKVRLLTVDEANLYFKTYKDRRTKPTKFAIHNKTYIGNNGNCVWWLKNVGWTENNATDIIPCGSISSDCVTISDNAVRPVITIDIDALRKKEETEKHASMPEKRTRKVVLSASVIRT